MHFDIPEEMLDRLHGPAGLYIASKTPAEIALSIMAEVVAVKNGVANQQPLLVTNDQQIQGYPAAEQPLACLEHKT